MNFKYHARYKITIVVDLVLILVPGSKHVSKGIFVLGNGYIQFF